VSNLTLPKARSGAPGPVAWAPQPRQAAFLARWEYEVLYGGAAGGGKSDALIAEALRQVHIPHYRGIIFRKTYPDASEIVDRSHEIYKAAYPAARYNDNKHFWRFPSGAKIYIGALQYRKDIIKYQGKRYDYIAFDELTHFSWDEYSYLFSRNRPGGPGTLVYRRNGTNPGSLGHAWVKARWVDGKNPLATYWEEVEVEGRQYRRSRCFVPSTVFDNKILLANDPNYLANLALLPRAERDALLYGSWTSFTGQVFPEWRDAPEHYRDRQWTHVITPFAVPREWKRYRSFDFGYSRPFSVGWYAVDYDGRLYLYRELYGWTGEPDHGIRWEPTKIAEKIREIEEKYERGNRIIGIADPSIWDASRGESIARMMEKLGVFFEPGENDRMAGKMQIHYRLLFDDDGRPGIYFFSDCHNHIRTVPNLVYDRLDVEDVDTKQEDHCYDECRYMVTAFPVTPKRRARAARLPGDPLDRDEAKWDKYGFMQMS